MSRSHRLFGTTRREPRSSSGTLRTLNLGYDGKSQPGVQATGRFCFFMGNDDDVRRRHGGGCGRHSTPPPCWAGVEEVMPCSMSLQAKWTRRSPLVQRGYRVSPGSRYTILFRRSGVISGYIVDRDRAQAAATNKSDGTLYYQMHSDRKRLDQIGQPCAPLSAHLVQVISRPSLETVPGRGQISARSLLYSKVHD